MKREQVLGIVIVALVLLAGIGLGWWLGQLPISVDAGLGFAGSLAGSALAVIGAIVIVNWEKEQRAKEHREVMHVLLDEAIDSGKELLAPTSMEGDRDAEEAHWRAALAYIGALDRLRATRAWFPPQTIGMAKAYSTIEVIFIPPQELRAALLDDAFMLAISDMRRTVPLTEKLLRKARWELQIAKQEPAQLD